MGGARTQRVPGFGLGARSAQRRHAAAVPAVGCWLLAVGCWLLAVGCWLLAVGCWLLARLGGGWSAGAAPGLRPAHEGPPNTGLATKRDRGHTRCLRSRERGSRAAGVGEGVQGAPAPLAGERPRGPSALPAPVSAPVRAFFGVNFVSRGTYLRCIYRLTGVIYGFTFTM
jgi:hypothetical protein